jgi:deoxyribose-phosphate aldolase
MSVTEEAIALKDVLEFSKLNANVSKSEIQALCNNALEKEIFGVCVPPYHISTAKNILEDSPVKLVTVCGFPFGYSHTSSKVESVKKSLQLGADEIDVVINFAAVKSGDWSYVRNDISSVNTMCQMQDKIAKIILEVSLLSKDEIKKILDICEQEEVNHVKTGTGLLGKDVDEKQVKFLVDNGPSSLVIKASGGVKTKSMAENLIVAGAKRIGSSAGLKLIK